MANMELRKLAMDVYSKKEVKFGNATGEEAINKALLTAIGGEWSHRNFRKNRFEVFEIIEDVLALPMGVELTQILNNCVEVENIGLGDKKVFKVPSSDKFRVAKISSGHKDLRRQAIGQDRVVEFSTDWYGVKIYEEFEQLVTGRVSFAEVVANVRASFDKHVTDTITQVVFDSYTSLTAGKFYHEGAVTTSELSMLISMVEAKTGMKCAVYGTKPALAKIAEKQLVNASDAMKNAYGTMGYIGTFESTDLVELPQSLDMEDNPEVPNDILLILPIGLKTIKVTFEGDPVVDETTVVEDRNDMQTEFVFMKKLGIAIAVSNFHGVYKITA